jgi:hypothetical protein
MLEQAELGGVTAEREASMSELNLRVVARKRV